MTQELLMRGIIFEKICSYKIKIYKRILAAMKN